MNDHTFNAKHCWIDSKKRQTLTHGVKVQLDQGPSVSSHQTANIDTWSQGAARPKTECVKPSNGKH